VNAEYAYTPYIWPMLASAVISAAIAIYASRHRAKSGTAAFAIQNGFNTLWALFTALEIAATPVLLKYSYHKLEAASAVASVSALLYFALARAGASRRILRLVMLLISGIALGFFILMATNNHHYLIWNRLYFDEIVRVERGAINFLLVGWAVLVPLFVVVLFFWMSIRSSGIYRQQALILLFATLLPVVAFFLELAGIYPFVPLDPVILVWSLSGFSIALAIFCFHMLSVVPIGRHTAIERMTDAVLILDAEGQIVDINPAARDILAVSKNEAIGCKAARVLKPYPQVTSLLEDDTLSSTEISIQHDGQAHHYQVQASPLTQPDGLKLGRLIQLRDVTGQKQCLAQILEHQRVLATLQERERLARELHDSTSQVLSYASLKAGATRKLIADGKIEKADSQLADLEKVISDAHADLREYILNLRAASAGDNSFFATIQHYLDGYCHNYGIQVDVSFERNVTEELFSPEAQFHLLRILQEALSNARRHACADCVRLSFSRETNRAVVRIQDNGHGFDIQRDDKPDSGHFGLRFMRERAEALGGTLTVQSSPGAGACVEVQVPIKVSSGI
jgi:PAS domain S-box-containing protein